MDKSLALCSLRLNCDWITYRGVNSFAIKCRMKRKQIRPMIEIERSRFAYIASLVGRLRLPRRDTGFRRDYHTARLFA